MDSLAVVAAALVVWIMLMTTAPLFRGASNAPGAERPGWRAESAQTLEPAAPTPPRSDGSSAAEEQADVPHLPHYEVDASRPIAGVVMEVVSPTTDVSAAGSVRVAFVQSGQGVFQPVATYIPVRTVTPTA